MSQQRGSSLKHGRNDLERAAVTGLSNAVAITAGEDSTCALLNDGTVRCWGRDDESQLGDVGNGNGYSWTPVAVSGVSRAVAVAAGDSRACAVLGDGSVQCWGGGRTHVPAAVAGVTRAIAVSVDGATCVLLDTGAVQCWGLNPDGELGDGTTNDSSTPVNVLGLPPAKAISAGGSSHTCALLADGTVDCWGFNASGELGNGTTANSSIPVVASGLSGARVIAAGSSSTCAILDTGSLDCWGDDGTMVDSPIPVPVSGLSGSVAVSVGGDQTCAVLDTGSVECWGKNDKGQLGNGTNTDSPVPVVALGPCGSQTETEQDAGEDAPVRQCITRDNPGLVDAGDSCAARALGDGTCVVLNDGRIRCWGGDNFYGQLGNGTGGVDVMTGVVMTPVTVVGISGAIAVAGGFESTCALLNDGTGRCWGYNQSGQLGNGTTSNSTSPVVVSGLSHAVALASGGSFMCAVLSTGEVQCWGSRYEGGSGPVNSSTTPVTIAGTSGVTDLSSVGDHICVRTSGGAIQCWGDNTYGQLGNSSMPFSQTPVAVPGVSQAVAVAVGTHHSCAVICDGTVECWGSNDDGQLGNGTTISSSRPVTVFGVSRAISVSAGDYHTCALLDSGSVQPRFRSGSETVLLRVSDDRKEMA